MLNRFGVIFFSCLLTTLFSQAASAQQYALIAPDVTLSVGYSNIQTQRATNLFYTHDGSYADLDFSWRLATPVPLFAGFGLTGSGYDDRQRTNNFTDGNYYYYDQHLYSDLGLFEIEPRIALKLGRRTGFFLEPRVGAGLLISSYAIDQNFNNDSYAYIDTDHHTGAAFEIRPALQAGYSWGHVSTGIEASYMYSWGNFGGLGRNAQEIRGGIFLNLRW